jgi:hypothetical protein
MRNRQHDRGRISIGSKNWLRSSIVLAFALTSFPKNIDGETTMKRSRFRYRLTTLLSLTFVIALSSAVWGNHRRALQREISAVEQISKKGGEIWFDRYHGTTTVLFEPTGKGGCGQSRVTQSQGNGSDFTDSDLKLLDDIRVIEAVNFTGSSVSPKGILTFGTRHPRCRVLYSGES